MNEKIYDIRSLWIGEGLFKVGYFEYILHEKGIGDGVVTEGIHDL